MPSKDDLPERKWPVSTIPAVINPDETVTVQVPSKYIARLIQLGTHAAKEEKQRASRNKAAKLARRRNRG